MADRGTFYGNIQGTPSRPLEYLTSSKAVYAYTAAVAEKLSSDAGGVSQSIYISGGKPVAINSTIGSKTKPVYLNGGTFTPADDIPTAKTGSWTSASDWVSANSGVIAGLTGSTTESIANVGALLAKSESWDSASKWVGANSASLLAKSSSLKITASLGIPSASKISYTPDGGNKSIEIKVPSSASHIGAVAQSDFNAYTASAKGEFLPITGGTITGDLVINQNLTVKGTTVSIDAQNLNVKDKLILVGSGSNTRAAANGAGIAVPTASAGEGGAARIQYDGTDNVWTASVGFKAPNFTGSLKGDVNGTASYADEADFATSASRAAESNHAVSASTALFANSASYASSSTTASYALVAESIKDASGLTVLTASYASHTDWANVNGRPSGSASFVTGAFAVKTYNPFTGNQTINIPTQPSHVGAAAASHTHSISQVNGLQAISTSVADMSTHTSSWNNVANTASAAYAAASQALATASVAQKEAESASYWKTQASASAATAANWSISASASATRISASTGEAAQYASNASASASLMYKNVGSNFQPVYMTEANGPVSSSIHMIETITDTRTSRTATLTGKSQDTSLYDGKVIVFRTTAFATTGSKASLNLTLVDGTTTGAKPVYLSGSIRLSTQYPGSSSLIMVYDATAVSASIQGAWRIHADRDRNTTYDRNVSNVAFNGYTTASNIPVYNAAASGNAAQVIKDSGVGIEAVKGAIASASALASDIQTAVNTLVDRSSSVWSEDNDTKVTSAANHYKTSGMVSGSFGGTTKVVTGFTTDAAGHVTSVSTADTSSLKVTSASYASSSTTASYALIAESVKDGAGLVVNTASFALDHYKPTTVSGSAIGTTAARTYIKAINVDKNNHVISVTSGSETVTDTDRYVATASFASTGSNGANGVKMTLTRRGSDTGTVVATIPVASTSAAGVMTGAQVSALNNVTALTASLVASGALAKTAIQPSQTSSWADAASNSHTHSNKAVLDGITAAKTASWDAAKPGTVTSITVRSGSNYLSGDTTVSGSGTALLDLSATTKGKVESGSAAHTWITANSSSIGSHTGSYLPLSGGTLTGALTGTSGTFDTVTVQKNLYVNGTASYVNTTDLVVKDKLILVSSGSTTRALANGAGIAVQTGSAATIAAAENAAAKFYYDGTNNVWSGSVPIQAASFTGSLQGTASFATSASRAVSAASADTASVLVNTGTTGSVEVPVYYNAGKLEPISVDSEVTEGSNKLVTSDAVYQAVQSGGTKVIFRQW